MNNGGKILIVDDDRDLVETIRLVLENEGYTVSAAHEPQAGLARTQTDRPDLILADVMMPTGTEGFHFIWKLRSLHEEYFRNVPVIVLTAIHDRTSLRFYPDSGDGTYQAGEYLPVQDFVDKPIDPDELLARIRRVLSATRKTPAS
jgi:DNA-binding response OmpR family regulator